MKVALVGGAEKSCSHCRQVKPITEFYARRDSRRYTTYCKPCSIIRRKAWAKANPSVNKAAQKRRHIKRRYGIDPLWHGAMQAAQNHVCAICKTKNPYNKSLGVDHDHKTGAVRGLLCDKCNRGIGHFNDDRALLRAALDYLDNHSGVRDESSVSGGMRSDRPSLGIAPAEPRT
jgi:hypothetical protein